jgi:hypothetical protein
MIQQANTRRRKTLSVHSLFVATILIGAIAAMTNASAESNATNSANTTNAVNVAKPANAMPSDAEGFTFLDGEWRVHNRKLKEPLSGREEWQEFEVKAKFFTLLDGLVSVEELRDAKGAPFGSAMRTFDRVKRTWSDAWVSARDGVLQLPSHGRFENGVGIWETPDEFNGQPILARGVWKRVSKNEVIWEQLFSRDKGKTWELTWRMRFERVSK